MARWPQGWSTHEKLYAEWGTLFQGFPVRWAGIQAGLDGMALSTIVLILAGGAGLALGSLGWTEEKTALQTGPLELKVQDRQAIAIPMRASGGVIVLGGVLLLVGGRRR